MRWMVAGWMVLLWGCFSSESSPGEKPRFDGENDVLSQVEAQGLGEGGPAAVLLGGPTSGLAPLRVYLDGTRSKPAADGTWIQACHLDYGDGDSDDACWGMHTYRQGEWTARFRATDNLNRSTVVAMVISVSGPIQGGGAGAVSDAGTRSPNGGPPGNDGGISPLVRWYGASQGISSARSISADEAGVVWAVQDAAIMTLAPGQSTFVTHRGVGQLARGDWPYVVCGGSARQAYVGYVSPENIPFEGGTAEQRMRGDLDRVALNSEGKVVLEHHYQIVNSNNVAYDEVRSIVGCVRQNNPVSPQYGEVYLGSNHAVTRVRGNDYADHRHIVFTKPNGSLVIGYNWAVALKPNGDLFFANEYKLGILKPTGALMDWLSFTLNPWVLDTYAAPLGPLEDPDRWHAAAVTPDGRHWLGSWGKGLLWMTPSPRRYEMIANAPDTTIHALAGDSDNSLWVGTQNAGLWRYSGGAFRQLSLPAQKVTGLFVDVRTHPRTLYIATDRGVGIYRGP